MTPPPTFLTLVYVLAFGLGGHHAKPIVQHVAGWTLTIDTDAFTKVRRCHLTRPNVEFRRSALILHAPERIDTSRADYRIDDGPVISVASDQLALAALGFQLENEDLDNPSQGLVRVPAMRLWQPRRISVQPAPGRPTVSFEVSGLVQALEAAADAGCPSEAFK